LLHREIEFLFPRIIALEQEVMRRTDEAARENGRFRSGIE
jgi:hypothetical protein